MLVVRLEQPALLRVLGLLLGLLLGSLLGSLLGAP